MHMQINICICLETLYGENGICFSLFSIPDIQQAGTQWMELIINYILRSLEI